MALLDSQLGQSAGRNGRSAGPRSRFPSIPSAISAIFRRSQPTPARRAALPSPIHAPELDCLRHILAPGLIIEAENRAASIGIGADQILIQQGVINEDDYVALLARHYGNAVEDFSAVRRQDCPLPDSQLHYAARHLILPIQRGGKLSYVQAPVGLGARGFIERSARFKGRAPHIVLTTSTALTRFLLRQPCFAHEAADGLADRNPELSAAPRFKSSGLRPIGAVLIVMAMAIFAPLTTMEAGGAVLAIWFLLFNSLRLAGACAPRPRAPRTNRMSDAQLPVYTVLIALYREGRSVAGLLRALRAFDYPPEKLDIKLVIEADDFETRTTIETCGVPHHVQVIVAPRHGPRTKPKALNYALPFARGSFLAVYDAEDRPDPGQLRAALRAFEHNGAGAACVQASLCIDNTADSWLARMFTAEYAGQFDAFLQGFSQFGLPLPLGGSSNHFRTDVLREVGAWDAYNVTEDADLGIRLARYGYRAAMFRSTTYEEAPARFGAWLKQRTRWTKGWMQTWIVHMRSPLKFWRESKTSGFTVLNLLIGGNILTALAFPILPGALLLDTFGSSTTALSLFSGNFAGLHMSTIAAGCVSSVAVNLIGLARRKLLHEAWVLVLTPLYWACLSLAAWRALFQLLRDPYGWEKTEHGLARHSRLASKQTRRR